MSRRDEYYFAKNREDLLSILQDLNQSALPSSPLKLSPLQAMEAGLTLPLFPLSVLPPLSFLRKAGYEQIHPSPAVILRAALLVVFDYAFP